MCTIILLNACLQFLHLVCKPHAQKFTSSVFFWVDGIIRVRGLWVCGRNLPLPELTFAHFHAGFDSSWLFFMLCWPD